MKVSLLDPGLGRLSGHHFDLDLRLARALARRGHEVAAHGFASPAPDLVAAAEASGLALYPTFRAYTYQGLASDAPDEAYRQFVDLTDEDLGAVAPADLWFWPTLAPYQFAAATARPRPTPQLGGVWFSPRSPHTVGDRFWARAARALATAPDAFTVGAYDPLLRDHYQTFSEGLEIVPLPCPHDGASDTRNRSRLRRIGFFGHQRGERGVELLPQLITALLARGFEVVVQDSGGTMRRQGQHPRLVTLPFVDDFAAQLARCDLVICPSRLESYVAAHSGVVSECIAAGVPVMLPSGCLPADLAARLRTGIFFHGFSPDAILEAVDGAADRFAAIVREARAGAAAWRRQNGADRLVDWIEAHVAGRG